MNEAKSTDQLHNNHLIIYDTNIYGLGVWRCFGLESYSAADFIYGYWVLFADDLNTIIRLSDCRYKLKDVQFFWIHCDELAPYWKIL